MSQEANTKNSQPIPLFLEPTRVLIVAAQDQGDAIQHLMDSAKNVIASAAATFDIVEVPRPSEIPTAIRLATAARYYDGFVALGLVNFDSSPSAKTIFQKTVGALIRLGIDGVCIGDGILAAKNKSYAQKHSESTGSAAAHAALQLIILKRRFTKTGTGRISPPSEHILMAGEAKGNQGTA